MKKYYSTYWLALGLVMVLMGCRADGNRHVLGSGTLEAEEVIVSSLLAGRVDSLLVSKGDSVEAGQRLALIDVRKLEAQLRQSVAALEELAVNHRIARHVVEQAEEQHGNISATLKRQRNLLESGSSTQQIVDDLVTQEAVARSRLQAAQDQLKVLEARREQLQATLELVRLQISDGQVTSPLKGIVIEKYVEAGENVAPGSPMVKIANLDRLWIKVYLSEEDVGLVSLGSRVQVRVDALPDRPFDAEVVWISPRAEFTPRNVQTREARADLVFAAKVEFENPDHVAIIGMPADVVLP